MANLLTLDQQQQIRRIASTEFEDDYDDICQDKEVVYLEDLLGLALLQDLQDNPTMPDNVNLLDGGVSYTNCYGKQVKIKGVRYMLAYFIYSDYIRQAGEDMTFSGMSQKQRADSAPISRGAKDNRRFEAQKIAYKAWKDIKGYLNENNQSYPLWDCCESHRPSYVVRTVRKV